MSGAIGRQLARCDAVIDGFMVRVGDVPAAIFAAIVEGGPESAARIYGETVVADTIKAACALAAMVSIRRQAQEIRDAAEACEGFEAAGGT